MSTDEKPNQKHTTLAGALVAAQRDAKGGPPSDGEYSARTSDRSRNPGQQVGYRYPTPEACLEWGRTILNRHGLALAPGGDAPASNPIPLPGGDVMIPLQYALEHESGERRGWVTWAPAFVPYGGTLLKGTKHVWSSAIKYAMMDVLACRSGSDDDEGAVPTAAGRKAEEGPPPPVIGAPAPAAAPAAPAPLPFAPGAKTTPASVAPVPAPKNAPDSDTLADEFAAVEAANQKARTEKMIAAGKATGMPGLAVSQYVLETIMAGEDVDLSNPSPLHAQRITAGLEALAKNPLPAEKVAQLALARERFLAGEDEPPPSPSGAPPVAEPSRGAPTSAPIAAPKPPAPPVVLPTAATDQRLSGRFSAFMKRASEERKAKGIPNANEEYLNRINSWARIPGLTSFAKPIGETERQITAEVMDRLEAGLKAWSAEPKLALAGK